MQPRASKRRTGLWVSLVVVFVAIAAGAGFLLTQTIEIDLTAAQVEQYVRAKFPQQRIVGPLTVVLSNPHVVLLEGSDRLALRADASASLPFGAVVTGSAQLSGTIAYDKATSTVLLQQTRIDDLRVPGLPEPYAAMARTAANDTSVGAVSLAIYQLNDAGLTNAFLKRTLTSAQVQGGLVRLRFGL